MSQRIEIVYTDLKILQQELETLFPGEKTTVITRLGRFYIDAPRMITNEELNDIHAKITAHYQSQDSPGAI
ncbi:hypothetical protein LX32DRAFT_642200 [Colletotrichum zoysiae]|uniref:Uncharacterized protein n=1 Tax=Colletotrichum zoysiae TaxID=1216348 RepID=A0AAD9HBL7_9PEZI|nr:hypothetical protein LX32DRAFT_642200 [Colletotrichum zoysiae]